MKRLTSLLPWLVVFILLDLYANLVPRLVGFDLLPWLCYALGFFVLVHLLGRYALGVSGLAGLGMSLHRGWWKNLGVGFAIGFGVWLAKNLVLLAMGKFELAGWMEASYIGGLIAQSLLGMLLASAINDLMIRGYWFAWFRRERLLPLFMFVATLLYVLDDAWNEGLDPGNMVFSAILGVALAYTVLKTGSIWMSIGIHWGGNVMFRMMSGFDGQGVVRLQHVVEGPRYQAAALVATMLLLPLAWLATRKAVPVSANLGGDSRD